MLISLIAATDKNLVIGDGINMPWNLPADLKYFKAITLNQPIIMGANTFVSIGAKPLIKRLNIVLSSKLKPIKNVVISPNIENSIETATDYLIKNPQLKQEIFIIGGGKVYEQTLDIADKIYLTKISTQVEIKNKVYFPNFQKTNRWQLIESTAHSSDVNNKYAMDFQVYKKIL